VMEFLSRLVEFKILVNWGMVKLLNGTQNVWASDLSDLKI
jgi:hypothetical protein